MGIGLAGRLALMEKEDGLSISLYIPGEYSVTTKNGNKISLVYDTDYPRSEMIKIRLSMESETELAISFRTTRMKSMSINGEDTTLSKDGETVIRRVWRNGDEIVLVADLATKVLHPIPYGEQVLMNTVIWGHNYIIPTYDKEDPIAKNHVALIRGPIVLAQDSRLGTDVDKAIEIIEQNGEADVILNEEGKAPFPTILEANITLADGTNMPLVDYASAGKALNNKMAAWMLVR